MAAKEIAVVSGKGGTGKTSIVASLIPYFDSLVLADCDVDAPDLHILLTETDIEAENFIGLQRPVLDADKCIQCGKCANSCNFGAITDDIEFKLTKCEGCGVCEYVCPVDAISLQDYTVGKIFTSVTKQGEMARARLIPGEETSGRLVAEVRKKAKELAQKNMRDWILIDGSPGIACNVISSITGVSKVVIVIEPTISGLHDLKRVHELVTSFDIDTLVVLNKSDLSANGAKEIEAYCQNNELDIALRIPFKESMVEAVVNKQLPPVYDPEFFKELGFGAFAQRLKS
ncbi:ATP-binding protein [Clostridia bacterium]|nr:ATP-binding protein [Clostridia bacterium]